jgi:hypothetical protein
MTYVLRERIQNRYYCKDHNKIIEFDTINEARNFLSQFEQYAMAMAISQMMTRNHSFLINDVQQVCQSTTIDEKPENCTCVFINYKNIKG